MLRNILLLIETTPSGLVAKEVAIRIAAQGNCNLTGLEIQKKNSIVDRIGHTKSPRAMLAEYVRQPGCASETRTNTYDPANKIDQDQWTDLNVSYHDKTLFGPKYAVLSQEAEYNDLTIIGRDGNVGEPWSNVAREIINMMLDYRAKPIIITPPEFRMNRNILIAYDGSPGSSRAVQLFVLMGLADDHNIHVLSVSHKKNEIGRASCRERV